MIDTPSGPQRAAHSALMGRLLAFLPRRAQRLLEGPTASLRCRLNHTDFTVDWVAPFRKARPLTDPGCGRLVWFCSFLSYQPFCTQGTPIHHVDDDHMKAHRMGTRRRPHSGIDNKVGEGSP
jgi:hypothetical protein